MSKTIEIDYDISPDECVEIVENLLKYLGIKYHMEENESGAVVKIVYE